MTLTQIVDMLISQQGVIKVAKQLRQCSYPYYSLCMVYAHPHGCNRGGMPECLQGCQSKASSKAHCNLPPLVLPKVTGLPVLCQVMSSVTYWGIILSALMIRRLAVTAWNQRCLAGQLNVKCHENTEGCWVVIYHRSKKVTVCMPESCRLHR